MNSNVAQEEVIFLQQHKTPATMERSLSQVKSPSSNLFNPFRNLPEKSISIFLMLTIYSFTILVKIATPSFQEIWID